MASYRAAYTSIKSARALCCSLQPARHHPPPRGQRGAPNPSPVSRVQNSGQERMPISPDSWRLLNPANYFLQITPSDRNLGRTLQVQGCLLSALAGARAHPRAECSSAGGDALETVAAAGICRRLLFCFSSPHGRWFWVGGGLSVFSCVSRSSGVRCDGAIQAPFPQAVFRPSPSGGVRCTRLRPRMSAKEAQAGGTRQGAVRQQGQVVGIKGSKAGGRCQCSDKSQKMERWGRQIPCDRG